MFDQTHPILLPSTLLHPLITFPSELYLLLFKTHLVHTVLPVCAWVRSHHLHGLFASLSSYPPSRKMSGGIPTLPSHIGFFSPTNFISRKNFLFVLLSYLSLQKTHQASFT